jgi:hypothetical protein
MADFRKPRSLFFPLLLIAVGVLFFLVNIGKMDGTTWDTVLKYWPIILIAAGLDGLYRRDGWVGSIVVLGLGTILLLGNLGYFSITSWALLLRFWPVILVAIGLDIAFGRRNALWSTLLRIGLGLVLVAGIFWLALTSPVSGNLRSVPFQQTLDGATSSNIDMTVTVGRLGLEGGAEAKMLIAGTAGVAKESNLDVTYSQAAGSESDLHLSDLGYPNMRINTGAYPWTFKVNSTVPLKISVKQAVGMQNFDLEKTQTETLNSQLAVGSVLVSLPKGTDITGKIECAVCQVVVRVPKGSNVVIRADTALVPVFIPSGYKRSDGVIEYLAGSGNKVNLEIDVAVGNLIIEEY